MPSKKLGEQIALTKSAVDGQIHLIRGHRVMVSSQLAVLYQVEPKVLVQAVKRNIERFPADFLFQLTREEFENLKSQFVTSSHGGVRRAMPYAFTEQGVAMLSSVLGSRRAIQVNIGIMRAFVHLRQGALSQKDLLGKVSEMEKKYDSQFQAVFAAIKKLMEAPPAGARKRIGFRG